MSDTGSRPPPPHLEPSALVKFFRHDEPGWGDRGDYEGWSTEETAIRMIRSLQDEIEAMRERLRIAEAQ